MSYAVTALIAALGVAVALAVYRLKSPSSFPPQKPGFCWFPKYSVAIDVPNRISRSSDPVATLRGDLSPLGFTVKESSGDAIVFKRGSIIGDISVKLAKIELVFPTVLEGNQLVTVQYGLVAAFDTGDLWTLASEVRRHIETDT